MQLLEFIESNFTHKTDKYDLGYIHTFYNEILSLKKESAKNILEIGIYGGDSIKLWQQYFSNAKIYGADINYCSSLDDLSNVIQVTGNAYSDEFLNNFSDIKFDVIIDDGSHDYNDMSFFLKNYLFFMKDDGVLILEDIIDREYTPSLLELVPENYSITVFDMRKKQKTKQLSELWSNGLDVIVITKK